MMATASAAHSTSLSSSSHKRKRGAAEQDGGRNVKQQTTNGDSGSADFSSSEVQQMLQGIDQNGLPANDDNTRTAQAALATPLHQSTYPEPGSFDGTPGMPSNFDGATPGSTAQALYNARQQQSMGNKPTVGTDEWHQQRKDNHKEVERRRREVINEGIENIAKVVPNVEKNKGAILQRTCQYIGELQAMERSFANERATFDVTLKELTSRLDKVRETAQSAWAESTKWQQRCRDAGLQFDDYDDGALADMADAEDGPDEES